MAQLSDDAAELDTLFAGFVASLEAAAAADMALEGAVQNIAQLRNDAVEAANSSRVAFNDFLRRVGTGSMTEAQRDAWRRIFGDLNDLDPAELGGAVQRAIEGL